MRYQIKVNGKEFLVDPIKIDGESASFFVDGERYDIQLSRYSLSTPETKITTQPRTTQVIELGAPIPSHPGEIVAPMPGIVVGLNVSEGQAVKSKDSLLVIEAMKMENNIITPRSGVVKKIHIKKGEEVKIRQLLISIDFD